VAHYSCRRFPQGSLFKLYLGCRRTVDQEIRNFGQEFSYQRHDRIITWRFDVDTEIDGYRQRYILSVLSSSFLQTTPIYLYFLHRLHCRTGVFSSTYSAAVQVYLKEALMVQFLASSPRISIHNSFQLWGS